MRLQLHDGRMIEDARSKVLTFLKGEYQFVDCAA